MKEEESVRAGTFVLFLGSDQGLGKCVECEDGHATVEFFHSIADQKTVQVSTDELWPARLSAETRCYVCKENGEDREWRMGRIDKYRDNAYGVLLPKREGEYVPEEHIYARCANADQEPTRTLALKGHETVFFYACRAPFVREYVRERAVARGLTSLLSSSIRLYPHQVEAVHRVLEDPIQRYLLADEVGLGKTIEAGVILRQHLLDDAEAQATVLVPPGLIGQWRRELDEKFNAFELPVRVRLRSTDTIAHVNAGEKDLIIIDEAHHMAEWAFSEDASERQRFEACRELALRAGKLLLLSATPAPDNERAFLAMLHLLDPKMYSLDDIEAFQRRVAHRQEIGKLLLSLTEGSDAFLLQLNLAKLRELLPADKRVQALANELEAALQDEIADEKKRDQLIRSIRIHVSETYRLHQRMVRSRREAVKQELSIGRYEKGGEHRSLVAEYGMDEREREVHTLLDEWRLEALRWLSEQAPPERDRRLEELIQVFRLLVEAAGSDLSLLAEVAKTRLQGKGSARLRRDFSQRNLTQLQQPLFDSEEALLAALKEEAAAPLAGMDMGRGQLLAALLDQAMAPQQKAVVFTRFNSVCERLAGQLAEALGPKTVAAYHNGLKHEEAEAAMSRFREDETCQVLVSNPMGTEGRNLQFARLIVHYDLPFSPNQLEQRIGRLDRIGRIDYMQTRVLIGPELEQDSLHEAWFRMLDEGLQIFSRSTASLQFYIDRKMPELMRILLEGGASALIGQIEEVQSEILEEKQKINNQDALNATAAVERGSGSYFDTLSQHDKKGREIGQAFHLWIAKALRFYAMSDRGPEGTVTYEPMRRRGTLVPFDLLLNRFLPHLSRPGSYHRSVAAREPGVSLYRAGHPFIEALSDYIQWDDRGRAFAIWRRHPGWSIEPGAEWSGFRFDFVVEADMQSVQRVLHADSRSDLDTEDLDTEALRRRADRFFPPFHQTVYLNLQCQPVENAGILSVLQKAPRKIEKGGWDQNLTGDRIAYIDDFVHPGRWPGLCQKAREAAEDYLRASASFGKERYWGIESAQRTTEERLEQLRLRMEAEEDSEAPHMKRASLDLEARLGDAIEQGIRTPRVRLDAIGFIIISGRSLPER